MKIIDHLPKLMTPIRWACFGALMSLPITIAGLNVFLGLAVLLALVSQEFWQHATKLIRHPVAALCLLLFLLLAVGTLYSSAPGHESTNYLWRYKKLLLVPLLLPFFQEARYRYFALSSFSVATFLTVIASWSEFFHYSHISDPAFGDFTGDSVFVMHITQGYLFAMLIALSLSLVLASKKTWIKLVWLMVATLTIADICYVMWGRTGKATLAILIVWACWEWLYAQHWPFRVKMLIQVLCIASVLAGVFAVAQNPGLSFGLIRNDLERAEHLGEATSQGLRRQFAKTGVQLFLNSPWVGHGTGSIVTEQGRIAHEAKTPVGQVVTVNLHNEYLMQAVQIGILGIGLFVGLVGLGMLYSFTLVMGWQAVALRGVMVVFAFGCLFNSYLWDPIEGYTWVLLLAVLTPFNRTTSSRLQETNPAQGCSAYNV